MAKSATSASSSASKTTRCCCAKWIRTRTGTPMRVTTDSTRSPRSVSPPAIWRPSGWSPAPRPVPSARANRYPIRCIEGGDSGVDIRDSEGNAFSRCYASRIPTPESRPHMITPTRITLHRASHDLEIGYDDGRVFRLPAEYLRVNSPSAEVQGHGPGQKVLVAGKRDVNIDE